MARMASIEVDELMMRTSEMLRRDRERGETIELTDGGQVIPRVVPVEQIPAASNRTTVRPDARRCAHGCATWSR